jgi:hypothetical protein
VGQRYVVDRALQLNVAESTAPMCLGALDPLAEKGQVLLDRLTHDGNPVGHFRGFRCTDPRLMSKG